jgi:hypothetical protein
MHCNAHSPLLRVLILAANPLCALALDKQFSCLPFCHSFAVCLSLRRQRYRGELVNALTHTHSLSLSFDFSAAEVDFGPGNVRTLCVFRWGRIFTWVEKIRLQREETEASGPRMTTCRTDVLSVLHIMHQPSWFCLENLSKDVERQYSSTFIAIFTIEGYA